MKITQERVQELLSYRDGDLIWRVRRRGGAIAGSISGNISRGGYLQTMVDGKNYFNHRIIWLLHHGYLPENEIDHIDRNRQNNRINNLREVSHVCNMRNQKQRKSSSNIKGVCWHKRENKWASQIVVSGKLINLGMSESLIEAACLRLAAEQAENWSGCESTSPAFLYVKKNIGSVFT